MPRGRCPRCDELVRITPTAQLVGETGTARRWRIDEHVVEVRYVASGVVIAERCEGSGKLV